jgi:hypothetical protein
MKNKTGFVIVLCIFLAMVGYLIIPPKPGVTRASFLLLHAGMTKEQIDKRLGTTGKRMLSNPDTDVFVWADGDNVVMIHFTGDQARSGAFRDASGKIETLRAGPAN